MSTYVQKINGTPIAASQVVPGSALADRLETLIEGSFAVVPLSGGLPDPEHAVPPVELSTKIIYLTLDSGATGEDKYNEWIYTESEGTGSWTIIGTTSLDLDGYVNDLTSTGNGSFVTSVTKNNGTIEVAYGNLPISNVVQPVSPIPPTSATNRTYPIQGDSNGNLVVNVPWTDAGTVLQWDQDHQYDPAQGNPAATVESITARIEDLDSSVTSSGSSHITANLVETNGLLTGFTITNDVTETSGNKVTAWQQSPDDVHYPSEKLVFDSLEGKLDAVTGATSGNFAAFNGSGTLYDSGKSASSFATAAQGTLADTAVQGGNIISGASIVTSLTVDSNKNLQIPVASLGTSTSPGDYGVVQIEVGEI